MCTEEYVLDSAEVTAEKQRIIGKLQSMSKEEILSIWTAIVECEQKGIEQSENYRPGISWTWWVEAVHHFKEIQGN